MVDLEKYYTYEDYINCAKTLQKSFEGKLKMMTVGRSLEMRELLAFEIGENGKAVVFTAGVHGRENINTVVMLKILEDCCMYAGEYWRDHRLCIMPLANPDGYVNAGKMGYERWKGNGRGVDVNRNFPSVTWKKKSDDDYPASEPETKAIIKLFDRCRADVYLDFHSRGNEIYYYRSAMGDYYNLRQKEIAIKLGRVTGYSLVHPDREMETGDGGGNTVHYFSEHFERPALTIETVDEYADFPLDIKYQRIVYEQIKDIWKVSY